jgi:hypothetical protein
VQLRTTIERTGATTTGIRLTEDDLDRLGGGKRPRVVVALGEHTYRTTVGSHDGSPFISVSAAVRDAAGVAGGDEVDVSIKQQQTRDRRVAQAVEKLAAGRKQP